MEQMQHEKPDIDDFIAKNADRYEIISSFQDQINHISSETYQSTVQYIKDNSNTFFENKKSSFIFFYCLYHFSLYNYKQLELILDLANEFSNEMRNNGLTEIDMISICSPFLNSINYLFYKKVISIESIIQQSYQNKILFINFYPEIEQYDPEYAQIRSKLLFDDRYSRNDEFKEFFDLIKSNPQQHIEYRNKNYHPSKLHKSIRDDDIEELQDLLSKNNYTVNHQIKHSFYERTSTCDRNVSLIQIAAVYGSLKVFKFLWMQNDIILDDNLQFYSYSGRNFEIIHICEEKCPPLNAIDFAINTHQNDLVEYFLDNFQDENQKDESIEKAGNDENPYNCLSKKSLYEALRSLNYRIILPSLKRITYIVENMKHKASDLFLNLFILNPEKDILENCLFDLDLFKLLYNLNRERYIPIKPNVRIYSTALFIGAYDAVRYMFDQTDKKSLFDHFDLFLKTNSHSAEIILDILDHDEYRNLFDQNDYYDTKMFIHSLAKYNEKVVVKMFEMFKCSHKIISVFGNRSLNCLSKKMIVSLCKKLSLVMEKYSFLRIINLYINKIDDDDCKPKLVEIKNQWMQSTGSIHQ